MVKDWITLVRAEVCELVELIAQARRSVARREVLSVEWSERAGRIGRTIADRFLGIRKDW